MKARIKNPFVLGLLMSIPILLIVFLGKAFIGFLDIWNPVLDKINVARDLYTPIAFIFTLVFLYVLGVIFKSSKIDWILQRMPLVRRPWIFLKSTADRINFISKGGYKKVFYKAFDSQTLKWRPGIVVGRLILNIDGKRMKMLVITQTPPNIFDPLMVTLEDTRIFKGTTKEFVLYLASGGTINSPEFFLEKWTEEEYEEIPDEPTELASGINGK